MTVIVAPEHLGSMEAICKRFRVGRGAVKAWIAAGAPIACEWSKPDRSGTRRLLHASTEYNTLQNWRVSHSKLDAA